MAAELAASGAVSAHPILLTAWGRAARLAPWQPSPMGCQLRVIVGVSPRLRVGVYQRGGQTRQRVQQAVLGADRDLVRGDRAGIGIHDDFAFGPQLLADPP